MHNMDVMIDIQRTQDASLIKANENLIAPRQALCTIIRLPKMFVEPLHLEATITTTVVIVDESEWPPYTEIGIQIRPTSTSSTIPEVVPLCPQTKGIVYIFTESIQNLVQRQICTKSMLIQLLQQIRPWVCKAISKSKERMPEYFTATLKEKLAVLHGSWPYLNRDWQYYMAIWMHLRGMWRSASD